MRYLSSLEETVHTKNGTAFAHLVDSGYNVNHSTSEFMVTSVHKATV